MTAKKNVVEKFKSFYQKLSPNEARQLYDLMAVMRSSDVGDLIFSFNSKHELTEKVRYILGINWNKFDTCTLPSRLKGPGENKAPFNSSAQILSTIPELINKTFVRQEDRHFREHARDAIQTLKELGYITE